MADITMCKGGNCPLKETCYRFKANINTIYQSYFLKPPYNKKTKKCKFYERNTIKI